MTGASIRTAVRKWSGPRPLLVVDDDDGSREELNSEAAASGGFKREFILFSFLLAAPIALSPLLHAFDVAHSVTANWKRDASQILRERLKWLSVAEAKNETSFC